MTFDYILIGLNLNSLMIGYYLNKLNYKILLIEKKSKYMSYFKNNTIIQLPEFSNNDVNLLNFLNDININFKDIGNKLDNIKFNLLDNFNINELITISIEFIKEFINDYTSKNIKFIDKISYFSETSIEYIKSLCEFYNLNYNNITIYEFTNMINQCLINEYYIIDEQKLFDDIIIKSNIKIIYNEEFIRLDNNSIYTNNNHIHFNNKCLFFLSPKNINFIKEKKYNLFTIYNYIWNTSINVEAKHLESIKYNYIKSTNKYIFYSKNNISNLINEQLFFINKNMNTVTYNKFEFKKSYICDNYIIVNNSINIEKNVINNYNILNELLINKKKFKIYKNDSIIDIIKFILFINLFNKKNVD